MRVSDCVASQRFSVIREMSMRAQKYENVITLGIGEPDMDTPHHICHAAYEDACQGYTHYAPSQGDPELLEALAKDMRERGYNATPERLLITHGAMHGLFCAMRTLLEPGDEVLIPAPHFPDYAAHVNFVGGVVKEVATRFEDGFVPTVEAVEAAITERTRVLLLNSPCNPTGTVIPGRVLDGLAELAIKHDLLVISDEVYDRILFHGDPESIATRPGMEERTLVVNSFSKTYAMTGWRVGYVFGPTWFMEQMIKVVSFSMASASTIGQRAALCALKSDQIYRVEMAGEFFQRSDYVYKRLAAMPGIEVIQPTGSFYLFPSVAGITPDGEAFAHGLLEQEQVVVIPGFTFGSGGKACVRLACTVDMPRLEQAMDRMERFVCAKGIS